MLSSGLNGQQAGTQCTDVHAGKTPKNIKKIIKGKIKVNRGFTLRARPGFQTAYTRSRA